MIPKIQGSPLLDRQLNIRIEQLQNRAYQCLVARVDSIHSNIANHWNAEASWPTPEQWNMLHALDKLDEYTLADVVPVGGTVRLVLELPMPGVARLRLIPR